MPFNNFYTCLALTCISFFRKYVPQLSKYPTAYIYEPWKAPLKVQEKAGCIVGKDYPKPIVEHDKIRKKNIERMAQAYNANKTEGGGTCNSYIMIIITIT